MGRRHDRTEGRDHGCGPQVPALAAPQQERLLEVRHVHTVTPGLITGAIQHVEDGARPHLGADGVGVLQELAAALVDDVVDR